ncbi:hypothetical protein CPLU01_02856 [Colletotrichum plurivorum]|uniref:Uncharacterized protein n=1 Tax=Colletotrichum plurivorum TaxID=2175906 RepID=A0A8H6KU80_9PEZI|nr:hypothetical protein CPLU01_02856 [Colletotrichum plurivorum]
MPPYTYRPPPGRQQYYESPPPPSAWHFNDWQSALPESFYVHTWVTDRVPYARSPPPAMSAQTSDTDSIKKDKHPATQTSNGGETSPRGRKKAGGGSSEGSSGGNGSRSVQNTEKQIVRATAPDPNAALHRERRLVEIRLLLQQLHEQIKPAHDYCKKRFEEFEGQISSLKDFADKETLDKIWADKQRAEARKREEAAARNRQTAKDVDLITLTAQVNLCLKHLKVAKEETWPHVHGRQGQDASVASQVSIVISAVEEVTQLAQDFDTDHYAAEDIVPCLEKAQHLTDTDSGLWKALFKRTPTAGNNTESGFGGDGDTSGNYGTDHTSEDNGTDETDQNEVTNKTDGRKTVDANNDAWNETTSSDDKW